MVMAPAVVKRKIAHGIRFHGTSETRIMHMALHAARWTRADLERLPDDGNRYEVVGGELFVTPPPQEAHQDLVALLTERLAAYIATNGVGRIHHPRSIMIVDEAQVEPDLMVLPPMPVPAPSWDRRPVPLLVVEVLSRTTAMGDRIAKRSLYLGGGVTDYWIVDGDRRAVTVVRPGRADAVLEDTLTWQPRAAALPFELDVVAFFNDALGPPKPTPPG
jgi:Uma2 family endonuclease